MKKKIFWAFALIGLYFLYIGPGNIFGNPAGNASQKSGREEGPFFEKGRIDPVVQKVRKGVFLVADPKLRDPNFVESVVLVTEHGPEGTMGVIVNRETETPLSRVFPEMETFEIRDDLLFIGGPVYPQGLVLLLKTPHFLEETTRIFRDVYFTSSLTTLARILEMPESEAKFRIFSGHAGWATGQLEGELAVGAWEIVTARPEDIFDADPDLLWETLRDRSNQQYIKFREKQGFSSPPGI